MKRFLGNTDIPVDSIVLGTWLQGGRMWGAVDDSEARAALREAVDEGLTTIDTAAIYGEGYSETMIGEELPSRRDKLTIFTKVFPGNYRSEQVRQSLTNSLERLKTDRVELLYMHWPPGTFETEVVPLEEPLGEMVRLKEEGKVRSLGVSNFPLPLLKQASAITRLESLQAPYSMAWRYAEEDTIPYCRENQMTFCAYSPLAQGLLSGKIRPGHEFPKGDHRHSNWLIKTTEAWRAVCRLLDETVAPIAKSHNATAAQIALAWCAAQINVLAVAGARTAEQARQNAGALKIELSPDEIAALDAASAGIGSLIPDHARLWDWSDR